MPGCSAEKDGGSGCLIVPCMGNRRWMMSTGRFRRHAGRYHPLTSQKRLAENRTAAEGSGINLLALRQRMFVLAEQKKHRTNRFVLRCSASRAKLAEIITFGPEIAPAQDDNFDEMVEQYGRVRRFLPHLLNTVKFHPHPLPATTLKRLQTPAGPARRQFLTMHQRKSSPVQSWKRSAINKENITWGIHALLSVNCGIVWTEDVHHVTGSNQSEILCVQDYRC